MNSPLSFLSPAIELIGKNASVLPATGGAFEDMARPDVEEADDRFFGSKTEAQEGFQDFAETPAPDWHDLYRKTPPVFRGEKHVFRYFCDGSIKTYFLGTVIEGDRSYPLELTQIGSAIGRHLANVNLHLARSLYRVAVKEDAPAPAKFRNFPHRKQHTSFIVRPHQRHDGGVVCDGIFQIRQLEQPVAVHRQIRNAAARSGPRNSDHELS